MKKYSLYLKDKSGVEKLLRSDLSRDALDKVMTAFELSFEEEIKSHLRVEEKQPA